MIKFDYYVSENRTEHNRNWLHVPDYPYRILIIGGSGSGKTIVLLKLIENQPALIIITTLKLILSIQTICMMFTKILLITIHMKIIKN